MTKSTKPYILGLDLGVQSVGWAMIELDENGNPCGIRRSGVRCFDSGVGSETEIASGKDESQNIPTQQDADKCQRRKNAPHGGVNRSLTIQQCVEQQT
ncbi:MAG: hypothetical protein WCB27_14335 [Thermoguttaceae bacterium]